MSKRTDKRMVLILLLLVSLGGAGVWYAGRDTDPGDELEGRETAMAKGSESVTRSRGAMEAQAPDEVVVGRVVGPGGAGLEALVTLKTERPPGAGESWTATGEFSTETDRRGAFRFSGVGYAVVELTVTPQRAAPLSRRFLKLPGRDLDVGDLVCASGAVLEGVVLAVDGTPLSGALVTAGPRARRIDQANGAVFFVGIARETARVARSDKEGRFHLEGVQPGKAAVVVTLDGYSPFATQDVTLIEGEAEYLEVSLQPERTLAVAVRNPEGDWVKEGTIHLTALDYHPGDQVLQEFNQIERRIPAGAPARVSGLGHRRYRLRVNVPEHFLPDDVLVAAEEKEVTVVVEPAAVVSGRIFDAVSGASIAPHKVEILALSRRAGGRLHTVLDAQAASRFFEVPRDAGLYGLVAGQQKQVLLRVSAPGYVKGEVEIEELRSAEHRRVDIPLQREIQLSGRILSHDYRPLAGALVTATWDGDQSDEDDAAEKALMTGDVRALDPLHGGTRILPWRTHRTTTAADGTFRFVGLAPGQYSLVASHPRQQDSTPTRYALVAGENLEDVEIQLRPAGGVTGVVLDENNRPVAGATVSLRTPVPKGAQGALANLVLTEEIRFVHADHQGRFVMTGIKPGSYSLLATRPSLDSSDLGSSEAGQVNIRIRPGRDLSRDIRISASR